MKLVANQGDLALRGRPLLHRFEHQACGPGEGDEEPKAELDLPNHKVTCSIASEKKGATDFSFELTPKVMFENGKAIKAEAHWGKIEAPTLIKSAFGRRPLLTIP